MRFTPLKSEPLLRLLIADLVGEAATRESMLDAARRHRRPARAPRREREPRADALPHRRKYLLLVDGFLRRLLELHLELVDEVERELTRDGDQGGN